MICKGVFVFKNINFRGGGAFTDANGKEVTYPGAYILKVDEIAENGEINERKFKIAEDKKDLLDKFKYLNAYDKINLAFKVTIYNTRISLDLFDVTEDVED